MRYRQPPSAPHCVAALRMAPEPRRIAKLSDDEEDGTLPMLDLDGGKKTQCVQPAMLRKKPSALQRKPATVRKRSADAEKAVTVPEVELEPKQDTAVVDDSQLLPDQPKKRCRYTGVASDAGHPPTKDKYHIMKYLRHGKDGTCAVRLKGGSQFTEINMPNATLLQNQEVAEAICAELNKGVKPDTVRELMSMLKEAMCKNISKG